MTPSTHTHVTRHGERLAYRIFGRGPQTLLCVHGLYRNGHDFDPLAERLSDRFRVITPDMIGRGDSDYSRDPGRYNTQEYVQDILGLAQALGLERYDYLGTSMGGMVGIALAAAPESGIRKLILNDVGPEISLAVLKEIGQRAIDVPTEFDSYERAARALRAGFVGWGALNDEQVAHLLRHGVTERDGSWTFRFDRDLIKGFRWPPGDVDLWPLYRAFTGPVLIFHGVDSPVLTAATAAKLRDEPNTVVVDVADAGHAPALMAADQIDRILSFLQA